MIRFTNFFKAADDFAQIPCNPETYHGGSNRISQNLSFWGKNAEWMARGSELWLEET